MATRPGLGLRATQRQGLAPQARLGLRLLGLPTAALGEELGRLAAENPFVTLDPSAPPATARPHGTRSSFEIATDTVAEAVDLGSHLRLQLAVLPLGAAEQRAARAITWSLDENGLLDATLAEIAEATQAEAAEVETALAAVQGCDPPGVAARDLAECLALQLERRGTDRAVARRALLALADLARGQIGVAAARTGLSGDVLRRIAADLPLLSAAPAAAFAPVAQAITPDLILTFDESGQPVVQSNGTGTEVRLDARLRRSLTEAEAVSEQLRALADEAATLVSALRFRARTLVAVGTAIVAHQLGFLDPARRAPMRPLDRQQIAERLGLHPSTVGRAVGGKYLAAPTGVFALSAFFSAQLGPDGPSAHAVQQRLAQLVAAEAPDAILSDEALAQMLQREGVDIARRTVAKYRGCLGIAPSHIRRRRKAQTRGDGPKRPSGPRR